MLSLPFDNIKIDKSFIDQLLIKDGNLTILNSMISLSHSLNKKIVAEGVETQSQKDYLLKEGCQLIQGYYYFKPMQLNDALQLLKN